ncbi:MAG: hypothetical protein ACFHX7_16910 [Pseudomonadota bacterium]
MLSQEKFTQNGTSLYPVSLTGPSPAVRRTLEQFTFEDARSANAAAAMAYTVLTKTSGLDVRQGFYHSIKMSVIKGELRASSLLPFILFESNHHMVFVAVRDYLSLRPCDIAFELAGLDEISRLFRDNRIVNKGAVLAGIVSMSDQRVFGPARALRQHMADHDIKSFARVQDGYIRASSFEFCLEWMTELLGEGDEAGFKHLGCSLIASIGRDQTGLVYRTPAAETVGFKASVLTETTTFGEFFLEVKPVLEGLLQASPAKHLVQKIINTARDHVPRARRLRQNG